MQSSPYSAAKRAHVHVRDSGSSDRVKRRTHEGPAQTRSDTRLARDHAHAEWREALKMSDHHQASSQG